MIELPLFLLLYFLVLVLLLDLVVVVIDVWIVDEESVGDRFLFSSVLLLIPTVENLANS